MHNHIHIIVGGEELSSTIRKFKSFTARSIIDSLKKREKTLSLKKLLARKLSSHKDSEYQVWQEGFHPKQIQSDEMMIQKIEYIHFNPVICGFVDVPDYWRYSSSANYSGKDGIIPITQFGDV